MNRDNYIISVDWFQVACKRPPHQPLSEGMFVQGTLDNHSHKPYIYQLTSGKEFNAIFGNCLSVELHGFRLATIYCEPRPSTIKDSVCLLKMSNAVLYSPRWLWYCRDIMSALGWSLMGISRIDICADFNFFAGDLDPREFIRRYLHSGISTPETPSYYRIGGNKYETIGEKKVSSEDVGSFSSQEAKHINDYLRFGKRSSGVCTYLYNKSHELDCKGGKRYIRQLWGLGGLEDSPETPVFRLEFSINSTATTVKRKMTDEEREERAFARNVKKTTIDRWKLDALSMDDFGTQLSLENVFWAYCSKYFHFKLIGWQRTPYNWKDVILFNGMMVSSIKPYRSHIPLDGGVSESNAAKRLDHILNYCQDLSLTEMISIDETIQVLNRMAYDKSQQVSGIHVDKVKDALEHGYTWDELKRKHIIPRTTLEKLRQIVENEASRTLTAYADDAHMAAAMDEYDATLQLTAEQHELWQQIEKSSTYGDFANAG